MTATTGTHRHRETETQDTIAATGVRVNEVLRHSPSEARGGNAIL